MKPWLKTYTARPTNPKVVRMAAQLDRPVQVVLGCMDVLYGKVADLYEDGIMEDVAQAQIGEWAVGETGIDPLEFYQAAKYVRLIDESPTRIHDWLDYFLPYLSNKYRGAKGKDRLAAILAKWEGMRAKRREIKQRRKKDEREAPSEPPTECVRPHAHNERKGKVVQTDSGHVEPPGPPAPVAECQRVPDGPPVDVGTHDAAGSNPRPKTSQQIIIERFVEIRGLSFSTRAAQKVVFRKNGDAARELDNLTQNNVRLALFFMDIAHEALTETLTRMSKEQGEEKSYKNLAALVKQWPEFGSAWENMLDAEKAKHLEKYDAEVIRLQEKQSVNVDKKPTGKASKELSGCEGGDGAQGSIPLLP